MISITSSKINFKSENIQEKSSNKIVESQEKDIELKQSQKDLGNEVIAIKEQPSSDNFEPSKKEEPSSTEIKTKENIKNDSDNLKNIQEEPKPSALREGVAKVSKFFAVSEEMTKGIGKGTIYGASVGVLGLGISWFTTALPKGFKKGTKFTEPFKNPIKTMSKKSKIITSTLAIGVFVLQITKAVLKSNQRKANIDHKLNIEHN